MDPLFTVDLHKGEQGSSLVWWGPTYGDRFVSLASHLPHAYLIPIRFSNCTVPNFSDR